MPQEPVPSKAALMGHPLHPMVIPFPIAFATAAAFTDIAYWTSDHGDWARASAWLLWATVATGVLAALLGAIDYFGLPGVRDLRAATIHAAGNAVALLLVLVNALIRVVDVEGEVVPFGVVLSLITLGLVGVTGFYGGELSYRHMIGVDPHDDPAAEPAADRTRRR